MDYSKQVLNQTQIDNMQRHWMGCKPGIVKPFTAKYPNANLNQQAEDLYWGLLRHFCNVYQTEKLLKAKHAELDQRKASEVERAKELGACVNEWDAAYRGLWLFVHGIGSNLKAAGLSQEEAESFAGKIIKTAIDVFKTCVGKEMSVHRQSMKRLP